MKPDNKIILADGLLEFTKQEAYISIAGSAYEVIRIIRGKALFFEDHIVRLANSLGKPELANHYLNKLKSEIVSLITALKLEEGNIRIDASFTTQFNYTARQIAHHYPGSEDYNSGVRVALLHAERSSPDKKIWNPELRKQADEMIATGNIREVLLVNRNNEITEGSRSNVFFIKGDKVISAPLFQVLEGITRKYVIGAIEQSQSCSFAEGIVPVNNLSSFDAAFLTGTSLKILPICSVADYRLNTSNRVLSELMSIFDDIIQDNLTTQTS